MKQPQNAMTLRFDSRSVNEGFARVSAAAFVAQLDPTLDELNDLKTAVSEAVTNCIVGASQTLTRPASPCLRPGEKNAAAWALPLWRALWTT